MTERIRKLRNLSLQAESCISSERARLITEFAKSDAAQGLSTPVWRAKALQYILEHKKITINEGELIVGERGPFPKATYTYPEITAHTVVDLDTLDGREKTRFRVDDETRTLYRQEIFPFWQRRCMRDRIFRAMSKNWKDAYDSGVFTEFMEQRAPGHTVLDDKIYRRGFTDFVDEIKAGIDQLDYDQDPQAYAREQQLKAMAIAAGSLVALAGRYAREARRLADLESDGQRKGELEQIAAICDRVPAKTPRTFHEALQYYWFVHLGVIIETNPWDSFNPGRLDQHLLPFYQQGLADGSLSREQAKEILQSFWVKFNNQPAPPKVGITAQESSTYTDFSLINTGGVKADGSNAVNELSYLILDVIEEMRILQPSSMVQISKKTPDRFLHRTMKIIRSGFGQPSIFNTDAIVQELVRQGKSIEDARDGGASGCVEAGAFGKESYILSGYFNLVKILELTLNNGIDPNKGKQLGPQSGEPDSLSTFTEFMAAFATQLRYFVDIKVKGNNIIERLYATHLPVPFLSLLIDDCIATGKDYHDGGARYNTTYIQGVGMGTVTDCLAAIQCHVYDKKTLTMAGLRQALWADFDGHERLRLQLINKTPKYGNDDDYADDIMRQVFNQYFETIDGRPNTKGGYHRINLLPTTSHVYFGTKVGATPDGRRAGEPLSEGISPVQGADRHGPSAVIKSVAKMDHVRTGGTLLNQKFMPQMLADDDGLRKVADLVRSYFCMDGHHMQFNVVGADLLREAQKQPEKYQDLIVRVAGYSDYFVDLSKELQDEIIQRTEHDSF